MLLDALAPSYAAVLRDLALLPTVQLSVFPTSGLEAAMSPWVLVLAETTTVSADGWAHETLHA